MADRLVQQLLEQRQVRPWVGDRRLARFQHALKVWVDQIGQRWLQVPDALAPPPPWPPAAAPLELDLEGAVDVGDIAANLLRAAPPPPQVHVVGADLCARHRRAVGADDAPTDREGATPAQPPVPVIWCDPNRRERQLILAGPQAARYRAADGL